MDRAVPFATSEGIELYLRTYYSLLRSSGAIRVRSLEEAHIGMNSSLHFRASEMEPDISAFLYAWLRLPPEIVHVRYVLLGQSEEVFARRGYGSVETWRLVRAPARRRRMFYDDHENLACFIASVSDIDDLIPILTAFQIEWNKMHMRLRNSVLLQSIKQHHVQGKPLGDVEREALQEILEMSSEDLEKLASAWGASLAERLEQIGQYEMNLFVDLLAGSHTHYRKAVQGWWRTIEDRTAEASQGHLDAAALAGRPVYFVSSNTHSFPNALCGYASQHQAELLTFLEANNPENLWPEAQAALALGSPGRLQNLLYYLQRHYLGEPGQSQRVAEYRQAEIESGVSTISTPAYLDVSSHIIELSRIDPARCDLRLQMPHLQRLRQSDAIIINIDYPLGMAAYHILAQVASNVPVLRGAYFMGKAATLNGRVGDVMIPNVVYDEHSRNTFLFKNIFTAADIAPYLLFGSVFDNQKAITVRGTFLQNREFMGIFYREGYTDIEMETGPYLSALYEDIYPQRYPQNELVNLFINAPYDIGVLHYASDTPYSRRHQLLSKSLSYFGVDATYATTIAILRRIFKREIELLGEEQD
ncbi:DUF6909 family protein [Candidatus Amarolinea aalborgensis]|uniref:DUF6909 family protein n=1 Tax=Candidatus Amarolinea aalborgensis TaxID=2249329 RepID=UPI003BF97437